jgi:hypothetical protein
MGFLRKPWGSKKQRAFGPHIADAILGEAFKKL